MLLMDEGIRTQLAILVAVAGCKGSEFTRHTGELGSWHTQELPGNMKMNLLVKILVIIGSNASIGFGIWHFFVPTTWKWYSYIDNNATELVAAVRSINVFFSLSVVLFGIINILLIYGDKSNRYSIIVMLAATSIL